MSPIGRLVALGVGPQKNPGEALIWSRGSKGARLARTVAVDVGKFPQMGEQVALAAPQILVLTHDDADHIGGWSGMASYGLETLEELWVPYEWGALVLALADDGSRPGTERADLKTQLHVLVSSASTAGTGRDSFPSTSRVNEVIDHAHERAVSLKESFAVESGVAHELGTLLKIYASQERQSANWRGTPKQVATRAVERAVEITRVIRESVHAGVELHYFSTDHADSSFTPACWKRSGMPGTVTIANAEKVEFVGTGPAGTAGVAFLLTLTIQNSRALCPVLWGADRREPAVLVWSDSGGDWAHELAGTFELLAKISVSTAPHHGSATAAHDPAWMALGSSRTRDDLVIVLAGGEGAQKLVNTKYRERCRVGRRGCTRCRHGRGQRQRAQNVVVSLDANRHGHLMAGGCRS